MMRYKVGALVTVREDDLFSVLNEAGYKVGKMRVDMNPIRPDQTGTLEGMF